MDISADLHPQILLTFGGKFSHREAETIDAEEFIAKKGLTAKGKKCSPYDLKSVAFGEPLVKPEDEEPAVPEEEPVTEMPEETVPDAEEPAEGPDAVDFSDWEPTLF